MKLKVCGMRDKENIKELLELEPAYMGLFFGEPPVGMSVKPQIYYQNQ